jgi:ribosomal protein S18 acetylase RimI-like enzyme
MPIGAEQSRPNQNVAVERSCRPCGMELRPATAQDSTAIALLHADSWRRNYRGAYSDAFLDGDVEADRRSLWVTRLTDASAGQRTIVAEIDDGIVGFVHLICDDDPDWGALVDNLHVINERKGQGIGTVLLAAAARALLDAHPKSPHIYLWVLEQNRAAQAFYEARGGTRVGRGIVNPPGGGPTSVKFRYAWPDAATLIAPGPAP